MTDQALLAALTADRFQALLGAEVAMVAEDGQRFSLLLESVDRRPASGQGMREPFSLLLTQGADGPLPPPTGLFRLAEGDLDGCTLFMNRVLVMGRRDRRATYEIVFA